MMPETAYSRRPGWAHALLIGLTIAGVLWYIYATRVIWPPITAAFLIAVVLDPLVDRLENRGWPRWIATAAIFLIFFGSLLLVAMYAVPILPYWVDMIMGGGGRSGLVVRGGQKKWHTFFCQAKSWRKLFKLLSLCKSNVSR